MAGRFDQERRGNQPKIIDQKKSNSEGRSADQSKRRVACFTNGPQKTPQITLGTNQSDYNNSLLNVNISNGSALVSSGYNLKKMGQLTNVG